MYVPSPGWMTGLLDITHVPFIYMSGSFAVFCIQTGCRRLREVARL